jgi:hypothetical protein
MLMRWEDVHRVGVFEVRNSNKSITIPLNKARNVIKSANQHIRECWRRTAYNKQRIADHVSLESAHLLSVQNLENANMRRQWLTPVSGGRLIVAAPLIISIGMNLWPTRWYISSIAGCPVNSSASELTAIVVIISLLLREGEY